MEESLEKGSIWKSELFHLFIHFCGRHLLLVDLDGQIGYLQLFG